MDPYRGGILQKIITFFLYIIMSFFYVFLKLIYFFKKKEDFNEPAHVIKPPEIPISSFKLAQALNPKTEPLKLKRFANDEDDFVRKAVCRNPSLPREELKKLSTDPSKDVSDEANRILKEAKVVVEENFPTQHGA